MCVRVRVCVVHYTTYIFCVSSYSLESNVKRVDYIQNLGESLVNNEKVINVPL